MSYLFVPAEEDLQALGKRKRKPKSSAAGMAGTEDEYEAGGTSPMVSGRAPQRRVGTGMGAGPARGSMADMGEEGTMPGGRERRKRKVCVGVGVWLCGCAGVWCVNAPLCG